MVPDKCLAVPFKNPLRCINDIHYIHAAVARSHMDVDSYEWYCWGGTAWISVQKRVFHAFILLQSPNLHRKVALLVSASHNNPGLSLLVLHALTIEQPSILAIQYLFLK